MKDIFYKYIQIYKYTFVRIHCTHIHSHVKDIYTYTVFQENQTSVLYKNETYGRKI